MKTSFPKNQMPFEIWSNYIKTMALPIETTKIPLIMDKLNTEINLIQFSHIHHVDFFASKKYVLTTGFKNGQWFIGVNRSMIYDKMNDSFSSELLINEIEIDLTAFSWEIITTEFPKIDVQMKKYLARQLKKYLLNELDKNVKF